MPTRNESTTTVNLYRDFGIGPDATNHEIDKAFKLMSISCHPDRMSREDPHYASKLEKFKMLSAARDQLKDPVKRAKYDKALRTADAHDRDALRRTYQAKVKVEEAARRQEHRAVERQERGERDLALTKHGSLHRANAIKEAKQSYQSPCEAVGLIKKKPVPVNSARMTRFIEHLDDEGIYRYVPTKYSTQQDHTTGRKAQAPLKPVPTPYRQPSPAPLPSRSDAVRKRPEGKPLVLHDRPASQYEQECKARVKIQESWMSGDDGAFGS